MEPVRTPVTAKDFFLWLGIIIGVYGSVIALLALLFEYINRSFPDQLAGYADPLASGAHVSMATLIVFVPLTTLLVYLVRNSIRREPGKEHIWVRRWAIVLTLFLAGFVVAIDLVTLVTTFLGGEVTVRFALKVLAVLLVGIGLFLHFLAERWGYWLRYEKKAHAVAIAMIVLNFLVVLAGFYIIGTPTDMRLQRLDAQKVQDLQSIQGQLVYYYQQKQELPESIDQLSDPISGFTVPADPETGASYEYRVTSGTSFVLCGTFRRDSIDTRGQGEYSMRDASYPSRGISDNWVHGTGEVCFERTIDPELYPPYAKPL
ncbi:MAG TPA: DUF5671 domain-containing protein [Candidatus Paceibacterota bacterium]|nr:DUF5671 domain-containing protein [Candidatus Paceibacterota bacterium]